MNTTNRNEIHPFERVGLGRAPFRFTGFSVEKFRAAPDAPAQPGSSCDYCGTGIMNVYWLTSADGRRFKVGCDCVLKTTWKADPLRAAVLKARREEARKTRNELWAQKRADRLASLAATAGARAAAFLAANDGLAQALTNDHEISRDLAAKLQKYGSLSPRQVDFAFSLYAQSYGPQMIAEVLIPAPEGRVVVRGKVVSLQEREGFYGRTVMKMVVKVRNPATGETWLAWGTRPDSLSTYETGVNVVGQDVEFTATLERGRDAHFAFFKRPTKAKVLGVEPKAKPVVEAPAAAPAADPFAEFSF